MSATYSVTIDFGTGPEEISQFVQNINRRESLYNDLEPVADTVTMQIVFNQDLAQKLLEAVDAPIVITKNASAFFKGVVLPLGSIAITGDGYGTVGSFLTIEARDNGYRLDRIHGWNGQDSIFFNAMEISKPSDPTNSVIHNVLTEAGYTAGEIGTLPTITKTITDTLRTEKEGTDATKIRPAFSGTSGVPYSDFLSRLCREIGYTYRFDLDGKFQMYEWAVDPSGVTPVGTLDPTNLMNYTLGRVDKDVDRFDVSYQVIKSATAKWTMNLGSVTIVNNFELSFSGTLNRTQYISPPLSTSSTFRFAFKINNVGTLTKLGSGNQIDFSKSGFIVNTQFYVTEFTVNPETLRYNIKVQANQGLATREYSFALSIFNDYTYFEGQEYKTASTGTQLKPQKIDTKYIDLEADASTYAQRLLEYTEGSRWEIDFETGSVLAVGGYYTLDSTNEIGFSNVVRVISREVTEENSVTNEYRWKYKAHFIGDIVFTEPAGALGYPVQTFDPVSDAEESQGIGEVIRVNDETTTYADTNFVQYDRDTKTLRINGDMILSGDSTVQGKIISGEGLESENYVTGSTGWKIDGDGNAEFASLVARGTIKTGFDGTARIELNQTDRRVSIIDSGDQTKVAMGYLEGLAKNDGSGNFGAGDYGFYVTPGDKLQIEGDVDFSSGDFLLAQDTAVRVELSPSGYGAISVATATDEVVGGYSSSNEFTISYWAKLTDSGSSFRPVIEFYRDATNKWLELGFINTNFQFKLLPVSNVLQTTTAVGNYTDGSWHFFTITIGPHPTIGTADRTQVFIDGVKIATNNYGKSSLYFHDLLKIRGSTSSDVTIDEFRVYNRQLSDAECVGLFTSPGKENTFDMIVRVPFDEAPGTLTAKDVSGNGNDITIPVSGVSRVTGTVPITALRVGGRLGELGFYLNEENRDVGLLHLTKSRLLIGDNTDYLDYEDGNLELPPSSTTRAPLSLPHGTDPSSPVDGDIWTTTAGVKARVNGSTVTLAASGGPTPFREVLVVISNNGTDPNNDVDFAPGQLYANDNSSQIALASSLTKRLDANWTAGSGNGGLDTGSKANSTWYYCYVIKDPSLGTVDAIFSTSSTSPTLPTGYTLYRRVGAVVTDESGVIRPFDQYENEFVYRTPTYDVAVNNQSTTSIQRPLTLPSIKIRAYGNVVVNHGSATTEIYIRSTEAADLAPNVTGSPLATARTQTAGGGTTFQVLNIVIQDGTIWTRSTNSATTLRIATLGWTDLAL